MSYRLEWTDNNIRVIFEGDVNFNEINRANNTIYGDSRFELMNYCIFDFQKIKKIDISEEEMQIISTLDKSSSRWNNNLKLAIISNDNENIKEVITNYVNLMKDNNWSIEIFNNLASTIEWCQEF
jgi:hypothetical protein